MAKEFQFDAYNTCAVVLEFDCPDCDTRIVSDEIDTPYPNLAGENARDSQTDNFDNVICPECNKEFEVSVHSTFGGGIGHIQDLDTDVDVTEVPTPPDEDY